MTAPAAALTPGVRDRIVEAAATITAESGWASVTMNKVAARAGVSRQTVYNEMGSKPALGQAMVMRELERFLAAVEEELARYDDLVEAIRAAAERSLVMARENRLLDAVLASAHGVSRGEPGSDNELLPFLTTDAAPLISAATAVIAASLPVRFPDTGLSDHEAEVAIDSVVRLVLSHVMQPGSPPEQVADDIAWLVGRVLRA
ncbi:MAG: TetR/AcrR family transcriptional regulator [Actinomycetes bacterium]